MRVITTYVIENNDKNVMAYYKQGEFRRAKGVLEKLNDSSYRLLCLKGSEYGQGRHCYEIRYHKGNYPGGVFLKTKLS
jgi:hypothetical protein